jgi:hypothetical protein
VAPTAAAKEASGVVLHGVRFAHNKGEGTFQEAIMAILAETIVPFAAAGYSLVYLLAGGGIFGAIVIFFIAKLLGR